MEQKAYPVLGPYKPIIDEWLEHDALEPRKQRRSILNSWYNYNYVLDLIPKISKI